MAKRTTHRSSKGKKLYAVRDSSGKFKDIQTYERAHRADMKKSSTAESKTASKASEQGRKKQRERPRRNGRYRLRAADSIGKAASHASYDCCTPPTRLSTPLESHRSDHLSPTVSAAPCSACRPKWQSRDIVSRRSHPSGPSPARSPSHRAAGTRFCLTNRAEAPALSTEGASTCCRTAIDPRSNSTAFERYRS